MKIFITGILILSLALAGCVSQKAIENSITSGDAAGPTGESTTKKSVQEPDPVSIPALMQKEFSGTDLTIGKVLSENEAYTRYYITYTSGELAISGIMNVPKGKGPFPLLILNHGHIDTDVYTNGRGLKREQDYLARRGYVVVHPDFRNHAESDDDPDNEQSLRIGYTEDSINAILAVRNAGLAYVDMERVGMLGHSMGGGITQNVIVVKPNLVQAAVLFAPVSSDYRDNYEKWTKQRADVAERITLAHGSPEEDPDFWNNISPRTFFDRVSTPILIHHGTTDESVPLAWSERTVKALEDAGKDVTLYTYPGEPHEFVNTWSQVMRRTVDFFDAALKSS
ncbi:MAG: alpha/beta fold hydrolase [Candidatus Komeilibacteria bacterium]|nr:alpha/beta fold hydrolase [Candidatus Komeilibacteria bacterium]